MSTPSQENFLSPPDVLLVSGTRNEAQLQGDSLDLGPQFMPSATPLVLIYPANRLSQSFVFVYNSLDKLKRGFPSKSEFMHRVHLRSLRALSGMFAVSPLDPIEKGFYIVFASSDRASIFRLVWTRNPRALSACGGQPAADYELQACDVAFGADLAPLDRSDVIAVRKSYYSDSLNIAEQRITQFRISHKKDNDDVTENISFTEALTSELR